ncbi:MAG: UDP-N-acetylmuramoyl-L-alanine--D-glutamate ligase [Candidatus Komeilibacteria bacterium]|nr:UDP-N-acetylmuramoyl-L-alanine--D-glutamate ligase [Candidatus Komeilibacteria bacterium]
MAMNGLDAEFCGKKVAILGFGVESQESVEFMLKLKAVISVFDEKAENAFDVSRLQHLREQGVSFNFGEFPSLAQFDIIVRSPGVKPGIQALHEAGDLGITITSATNIFLEHAQGTVVGITGTKGKGTTAALLYEMVKTTGRDAYIGGNIGIPALSFLDILKPDSVSILELSSFQLMDATRSPHIAIVLMVTQDHLDYHTSAVEYIMAKMGIASHQSEKDSIIVNIDYRGSVQVAGRSAAKRYEISKFQRVEQGCFTEHGFVVVALGGVQERIIDQNSILIPGKHNLENVCAATMAGKLLGIPNENIAKALRSFRGLAHRLELVREIDGVKYYNDSIGTTPDSAIAAIQAFDAPKILILGGSTKHSDFTELGNTIAHHPAIKAIIGIGEEWPRIRASIPNHPHGIEFYEDLTSMQDIVEKVHSHAEPGDVVILSPACASFDMFKDYKDRGDQFKFWVEKL